MIIDLANVGTVAKKIDAVFDPAEIDLDGEIVSLNGKAEFSGETRRLDGKAHVRGTIQVDGSIACTRCLEPISRQFEIGFDDIFEESSDENAEHDKELELEELDVSLVNDGKIDLAEVVREQVLLAIPEQIFCRDDCKGLCPKCGANLNLIDCMCADDDIDPRWAALKSLK